MPDFRKTLAIIHAFVGLTALVGGFLLISENGFGTPLEWLAGSPFSSYFWPGVILLGVVGGTSVAAACATWKKAKLAEEVSATASFGIQLWIFFEIYIIKQTHPGQVIYFALGAISLILLLCGFRRRLNHPTANVADLAG